MAEDIDLDEGGDEDRIRVDENKKTDMSDYDMSKYVYSLVKNGYSILAPEPSQRSRSYRDLILQEMNWMAVDYYHERRWKKHVAKEIISSIQLSVINRNKLKHDWPAKQCCFYITNFWLNLKKVDISNSLYDYCTKIYNSNIKVLSNNTDYIDVVPTKEIDLIALSVPIGRNANKSVNDVVSSTLNHMVALGAELYPCTFRPPRDELDVFTLPSLNKRHDFDYNILMLLLYSLKNSPNIFLKGINPSVLKGSQSTTSTQSYGKFLPIRRIPRDDIDPFCISINYRDFLEQQNVQSVHVQKLILKWDEILPSEADFELLDDWMLKDLCWPFIAIALNLRCCSGGLLAHEFNSNTCQVAFNKITRTPRGLINSSRKLLGPKQSKTILSFIDPPPTVEYFKPIVPFNRTMDTDANETPTYAPPEVSPADSSSNYLSRKSIATPRDRGGGDCSDKASRGEPVADPRELDGKLNNKGSTASGVKEHDMSLEREVVRYGDYSFLFTENIKSYIGKCKIFSKTVNRSSKSDGIFSRLGLYTDDSKGTIVLKETDADVGLLIPENIRDEVGVVNDECRNRNFNFYKVYDVKNDLIRKLGYSEWSNKMHKQLRIGFLGIPTKMFVYSLFYSGRIRCDYRVRRVALSISTISKFVPPQHLLYSKMFEADLNTMLTKSRIHNWDKQRKNDNQYEQGYTQELVQRYISDINSSVDENNLPELLATYAKIALSKGETCAQGSFSYMKIIVNSNNLNSTSSTSSTSSELKRKPHTPLENTPKHRVRQQNQLDYIDKGQQLYRNQTPDNSIFKRQPIQMYHNIPPIINGKYMYNPLNIGSPHQPPIQHWNNTDDEYIYRFNEQYRR